MGSPSKELTDFVGPGFTAGVRAFLTATSAFWQLLSCYTSYANSSFIANTSVGGDETPSLQ